MFSFDVPTVAIGLVILGLCQLAHGYRSIRTIIRELPIVRRSWRALEALIILFAVCHIAFAIYLSTGGASPFALILALVFAAGGSFILIIGRVSRDSIGEAQRLILLTEEHSETTNDHRRLQTILDNAAEGIITFNDEGQIESCNRAAEFLLGYRQQYLQGRLVSEYIAAPVSDTDPLLQDGCALDQTIDRLAGEEMEMVLCNSSGARVPISANLSRILIDERQIYTALISDIRERKNMLDSLRTMAERDTTTRLFNRSYFQLKLEQAVSQCNTHRSVSVLCIDLDNFKMVNDVLGHAAGDSLLIDVARVLEEQVNEQCLVARYGGDEFTVLITDASLEQATELAEKLRQSFEKYLFVHEGREVDIGCSIGIARTAESGSSSDALLDRADTACHLAKRAGRNCVHVFQNDDQADPNIKTMDLGWSRRIKKALEEDRFVLAGQPIVNIVDGTIDGHEILVRLRETDGSLIMPNAFLPTAIRLGLASSIDKWVVKRAIELLSVRRRSNPNARFAINLSAQTLGDFSICDLIEEALARTGLAPEALTFEVAETYAITDMKVAGRLLTRLRKTGCRTALNDFGSGLSSFAYLRDLPVDLVKIDGRFVRKMATNDVDVSIVNAINDVVHASGMQTVVEYMEDGQSLELLETMGVDYVQGYHFGKPALLGEYTDQQDRDAA